MEINRDDLKEDQLVWGCGYSTNSTEKSMAFRKRPVLGIIKLPYGNKKEFHELNRKGEMKTAYVNTYARHYANTEEESVDIYNELVLKQIDILSTLIDNCRNDFISNEED